MAGIMAKRWHDLWWNKSLATGHILWQVERCKTVSKVSWQVVVKWSGVLSEGLKMFNLPIGVTQILPCMLMLCSFATLQFKTCLASWSVLQITVSKTSLQRPKPSCNQYLVCVLVKNVSVRDKLDTKVCKQTFQCIIHHCDAVQVTATHSQQWLSSFKMFRQMLLVTTCFVSVLTAGVCCQLGWIRTCRLVGLRQNFGFLLFLHIEPFHSATSYSAAVLLSELRFKSEAKNRLAILFLGHNLGIVYSLVSTMGPWT